MKSLSAILLCVVVNSTLATDLTGLIEVWRALGWRHVQVVVGPARSSPKTPDCSKLVVTASNRGISVAVVSDFSRSDDKSRFLLFEAGDLEVLVPGGKPYSLMLHEGGNCDSQDSASSLGSFQISAGFFKTCGGPNLRLFRVQTFTNSSDIVEEEWFVDPATSNYKKTYDMGGGLVSAVALTWKPYLDIDGCDTAPFRDCHSTGILTDLMDVLASQYNFTWRVDRQPDGQWGSSPRNANGTTEWAAENFYGLLGSVVADAGYDVALSSWSQVYERSFFLDLTVPFHREPMALVVGRRDFLIDMHLFLRPFTSSSWAAVAAFVATASAAYVVLFESGFVVTDRDSLWSRKLALAFGWLFFLLVNTFYGGAMTMFFTSPPSQPFSSMREGLSRHPSWEMVLLKALEARAMSRVAQGDPLYVDWKKRHDQQGLVFDSFLNVMDKLQEGRYFTEVGKTWLSSYLAANNLSSSGLQQVGVAETIPIVLMLRKDSPLTAAIDRGLERLRRGGVLEVMVARHQRVRPFEEQGIKGVLETKVLGAAHVGGMFVALAAVLGAVALLFCAELAHWRYQRMSGAKRARPQGKRLKSRPPESAND